MRLDEARDFWRSRGVPEEAIEDLWDMSEAARYNDAIAEETSALVRVLRDAGWHEAAVEYMAEQRALRAVMVVQGAGDALREFARKMQPAIARGVGEGQLAMMASVWIDGFAACARANKLREQR